MERLYVFAAHADNVGGRGLTVASRLVGMSGIYADSVVVGKFVSVVSGNAIIALYKFVCLTEKVAAGVSYGVSEGLGGKDYALLLRIGKSAGKLLEIELSHKLRIWICTHINIGRGMYDADGSAECLGREYILADIFDHYLVLLGNVLKARAFSVCLTDHETERACVVAKVLEILIYLLIALCID